MNHCATVCWNAIVRNEARAIGRCMASLVGHIDYWVVVDTGSDDDTPNLIQDFFREHGIPGELHRRPWVDFGHNRTEALRLAEGKADYLLFMDADMALEVADPQWKRRLVAEGYLIRQRMPTLVQQLPRLVSARSGGDRRWRYRGATHEFLGPERMDAVRFEEFDGIAIRDFDDGGFKADKFARDAQLLEAQLARLDALADADPAALTESDQALLRDRAVLVPRTLFYLAESYRNGRIDLAKAVDCYRGRIDAGGWSEEIAFSWLQIGACLEALGEPWEQAQAAYLSAFQASPRRGEALLALARHYNRTGEHAIAHLFAAQALQLGEPPADGLFVDRAAHRWMIPEEYALSCYWTGRYREAEAVWRRLLDSGDLPDSERPRVEANLGYVAAALGQGQ